jgi:hypothetical protein
MPTTPPFLRTRRTFAWRPEQIRQAQKQGGRQAHGDRTWSTAAVEQAHAGRRCGTKKAAEVVAVRRSSRREKGVQFLHRQRASFNYLFTACV